MFITCFFRFIVQNLNRMFRKVLPQKVITGSTTDSQSENYSHRSQHFGEFVPSKPGQMHVIGACSIQKAPPSVQSYKKRRKSAHKTAIPELSLNPRVQNALKSLENLLEKGRLSRIDNLILWQDLVNKHFVETLNKIKYNVFTTAYCRQFGAPDVYRLVKTIGIIIISFRKKILSERKQACPLIQRQDSELRQDSVLEMKSLQIVLNNVNDLRTLSKNFEPKPRKPFQKKRKALARKQTKQQYQLRNEYHHSVSVVILVFRMDI